MISVDALMRRYEPLLWRALDASNAAVRRNAATLFIDAFPLQDADTASRADIDALLQRQFDALSKLLHDDAPTVRVVGVQGVCRVLSVFWELIPAATAKNLLKVLVTKMAYDVRGVEEQSTGDNCNAVAPSFVSHLFPSDTVCASPACPFCRLMCAVSIHRSARLRFSGHRVPARLRSQPLCHEAVASISRTQHP